MTDEVRARKDAQLALPTGDTNGGGDRAANGEGNGNGTRNGHANGEAKATEAGGDTGGSDNPGAPAKPATAALTDTPPVIPAKMGDDLELGPACDQCGGMMQRTGSCYTCSLVRQQHRLRLSASTAVVSPRLSTSSAYGRISRHSPGKEEREAGRPAGKLNTAWAKPSGSRPGRQGGVVSARWTDRIASTSARRAWERRRRTTRPTTTR